MLTAINQSTPSTLTKDSDSSDSCVFDSFVESLISEVFKPDISDLNLLTINEEVSSTVSSHSSCGKEADLLLKLSENLSLNLEEEEDYVLQVSIRPIENSELAKEYSLTSKDIWQVFQKYGGLKDVKMFTGGCAKVYFETELAADTAVKELNGRVLAPIHSTLQVLKDTVSVYEEDTEEVNNPSTEDIKINLPANLNAESVTEQMNKLYAEYVNYCSTKLGIPHLPNTLWNTSNSQQVRSNSSFASSSPQVVNNTFYRHNSESLSIHSSQNSGSIGSFSELDITPEKIELLINERNEARRTCNFQEADRIREFLKAKNIALMDEPGGRGKGSEVTTWRVWRK